MLDFSILPNIVQEHFIINMDRIPDYRHFKHPIFANYLFFGMYAAPECRPVLLAQAHPNDRIITEYYNVWFPIWGTTQCGYFGSIQVEYFFLVLDGNSRADPSEEKYHNADVVRVVHTFTNPLTRQQMRSIYSGDSEDFPYFMKFKDMFNDAYFEPMRNTLLMLITRPTGGNVVHQTVNPGQYTRRAQQFYTRHMNTGLPQTNDLASLKKQASDLMKYLKRNTYYIRGADQNLKDLQHELKEAYKDYANREQVEQQAQRLSHLSLQETQATQQAYESEDGLQYESEQPMEEEMDYH